MTTKSAPETLHVSSHDIYDAVIVGLLDIGRNQFGTTRSDIRRFGRICYRIYLDLDRMPMVELDFYRCDGWDHPTDEAGLRFRIASMATQGFIRHWGLTLAERDCDPSFMQGIFYRLPWSFNTFRTRLVTLLDTTH